MFRHEMSMCQCSCGRVGCENLPLEEGFLFRGTLPLCSLALPLALLPGEVLITGDVQRGDEALLGDFGPLAR